MTTSEDGSGFGGKLAIVSGGASGIGAAVAQQLRNAGATVEIADVRIAAGSSGTVVDVTQGDSVARFAEAVAKRHGRCDVLVNCAGVVATGTADQCTEQDWDRVFAVNVRGVWQMCHHLLPLMPPGSAIVNVSSAAALRAIPDMAAYVASKAAVVGLSKAMALDHAPQQIRVNCVCPGLVDTPLAHETQQLRPKSTKAAVAAFDSYLIKRQAAADEIAAAICFLASDNSRYITGIAMAVDGGRTMH